jgi:hypothetical protein
MGSEIVKVLPCPGALVTQIRPPCASTAILQNVRPSPRSVLRPYFFASAWQNFSKMTR